MGCDRQWAAAHLLSLKDGDVWDVEIVDYH